MYEQYIGRAGGAIGIGDGQWRSMAIHAETSEKNFRRERTGSSPIEREPIAFVCFFFSTTRRNFQRCPSPCLKTARSMIPSCPDFTNFAFSRCSVSLTLHFRLMFLRLITTVFLFFFFFCDSARSNSNRVTAR